MTFNQWLYLVGEIQDANGDVSHIACPSCSATGSIDFQYVGNPETRIGYVAIWCTKCNQGFQSSRAEAPIGFDLLPFGTSAEEIRKRIPSFEHVEPVSIRDE